MQAVWIQRMNNLLIKNDECKESSGISWENETSK